MIITKSQELIKTVIDKCPKYKVVQLLKTLVKFCVY